MRWLMVLALTALAGCGAEEMLEGPDGFTEQDILRGEKVESWDEVRFMASLQAVDASGDGHVCGASIIDPSWVITAAHCVVDFATGELYAPPSAYSVVVKDLNLVSIEDAKRIAVSKVVVHPQLSRHLSGKFDMALVKLASPVPAEWAIPLDNGGLLRDGLPVRTYGWGLTTRTDPKAEPSALKLQRPSAYVAPAEWGASNALRSLPRRIVDLQGCNEMYVKGVRSDGYTLREFGVSDPPVPTDAVCAGRTPDQSIAGVGSGDSGGPLVAWDPGRHKRVLVGVLSWGIYPWGDPKYPDVFERVTTSREFIRTAIAQ